MNVCNLWICWQVSLKAGNNACNAFSFFNPNGSRQIVVVLHRFSEERERLFKAKTLPESAILLRTLIKPCVTRIRLLHDTNHDCAQTWQWNYSFLGIHREINFFCLIHDHNQLLHTVVFLNEFSGGYRHCLVSCLIFAFKRSQLKFHGLLSSICYNFMMR